MSERWSRSCRQRLLRRHVLHGADHGSGLGHAIAFERPGQTEVHDQDAAGLSPT